MTAWPAVIAFVLAAALPPAPGTVTLTGTRTVAVTGAVYHGPAPGTYAVTETDIGLGSRSIAFGPPAVTPSSGVQPLTEAVQSIFTLAQGEGPIVRSSIDTVYGIDRGAHQQYEVRDVQTTAATYEGTGLGAVEHVTERGSGTNGGSFADVDFMRTTKSDGSFDETGSLNTGEAHDVHVARDFSATAHDQTPGFGLRDVTSGTPSGSEPSGTIQVTVATQGRTVGPTPVMTQSFVVPVWFAGQRLPTRVEHDLNPTARFAPDCGAPPALVVQRVHDRRMQIDPTGTIREIVHDLFADVGFAPLCRVDRTSITYIDVTTGKRTGMLTDQTVVSTYR
jgi:hypothetical protein